MLTAKGQEVDKVVGLETGADDYIVKPFGVHELLARIRSALRRKVSGNAPRKNTSPFALGNITVNPATLSAMTPRGDVALTAREVHLLEIFSRRPGEVIRRDTLLDEVWGIKYEGTTRTLDQHIAKLRQKIEADPASPRVILTVHGTGYRFPGGK
jgi:DNA-binding response OmpR family regulator